MTEECDLRNAHLPGNVSIYAKEIFNYLRTTEVYFIKLVI